MWGYFSCAPAEVPPLLFACFKLFEISDNAKSDEYSKENIYLCQSLLLGRLGRASEGKNKALNKKKKKKQEHSHGDRRKCDKI